MDEACELRSQGWTTADLAEYFSVQPDTIRRWLDPAYDEAVRVKSKKRQQRYRGKCLICGARTSGSNGAASAPKYCSKHWTQNPDRVIHELWSKQRIIHAIKEWAAIHGEPPSMADWNSYLARKIGDEKRAVYFEQNKDTWPWFTHAVKKFGSWNAAIEAAGFSPRPPHGTFGSAQKNRRWQEDEEIPNPKPRRYWTREAAGFSPHPKPRRYWTRELLIEKMQEYYVLYGKPPNSNEWLLPIEIVNGYRIWPTTGAIQKEFGSWSRGIRAAGLQPRHEKKVIAADLKGKKLRRKSREWTKEEILDIFRVWVAEHRLPPTKYEWSQLEDRPSPTTVYLMFGSWNEAVKQAGFFPFPHGTSARNVKKLLPLPRKR